MPIVTCNDPLSGVESKVFSGERLSLADGLALLESPDLMRIGHLADRERERIVGDSVYFNCNRHINYTNICRNLCDFCAFSRDVGEEGACTLRPEEILEKASEALDYGVTELHIVGGEHPDLPYEEVRRMIVDLHAFAPGVHLKAFTVSEIAHFAASTGMGEEEVLLDLKEAGLGSLPGGGAEIFAERVRSQVCSRKISGERWLEIHKLAHRRGHIGFLNCYPIYYGLREGGATEPPEDGEFSLGTGTRIRLVPGVPTDLNRMLAAGTIDFGPISSIAYARHHRSMAISSRLSISSRGAVDSIQLVARRPLEEVEQVALTPKSATSVVLLKVILSLRYGIHPRYEELEGDVPQALEDNDAVLLIGDEALEAMYYPESDTLRYDLGVVWREWTGLPMVYAVWAARAEYMGFAAGELLVAEA